MTLKDVAQMFNRAFAHAFGKGKFFVLFITLFLSGLVFLVFQGIASYAAPWFQLPLKVIPLFVIFGLVMAAGTLMILVYDQELNGKTPSVSKSAWHAWDTLFKASYLALPLLFAFLLFWVVVGIFLLLKAIPYLGTLFGVVLAFIPYLLNFATLLLFLLSLFALFFVAPHLARREKIELSSVSHRLRENLFINLLFLGIAYLPVWIVWKFVMKAATMTYQLFSVGEGAVETALQSIFVLLPIAAIMTPAALFFFNFAHEAALISESLEQSS